MAFVNPVRSTCSAWADTITVGDGNQVSSWTASTGSVNGAQATNNLQPVFKQALFGGKGGLDFYDSALSRYKIISFIGSAMAAGTQKWSMSWVTDLQPQTEEGFDLRLGTSSSDNQFGVLGGMTRRRFSSIVDIGLGTQPMPICYFPSTTTLEYDPDTHVLDCYIDGVAIWSKETSASVPSSFDGGAIFGGNSRMHLFGFNFLIGDHLTLIEKQALPTAIHAYTGVNRSYPLIGLLDDSNGCAYGVDTSPVAPLQAMASSLTTLGIQPGSYYMMNFSQPSANWFDQTDRARMVAGLPAIWNKVYWIATEWTNGGIDVPTYDIFYGYNIGGLQKGAVPCYKALKDGGAVVSAEPPRPSSGYTQSALQGMEDLMASRNTAQLADWTYPLFLPYPDKLNGPNASTNGYGETIYQSDGRHLTQAGINLTGSLRAALFQQWQGSLVGSVVPAPSMLSLLPGMGRTLFCTALDTNNQPVPEGTRLSGSSSDSTVADADFGVGASTEGVIPVFVRAPIAATVGATCSITINGDGTVPVTIVNAISSGGDIVSLVLGPFRLVRGGGPADNPIIINRGDNLPVRIHLETQAGAPVPTTNEQATAQLVSLAGNILLDLDGSVITEDEGYLNVQLNAGVNELAAISECNLVVTRTAASDNIAKFVARVRILN